MRVLVAEDEKVLADLVASGLRAAGMAVDVCYDGSAAEERIGVHEYDVAVLDRDLPGVHGDELCVRLLSCPAPARVLMLTAASDLENRVHGLELGADDYLTKPFEYPELLARVRALGRRAQPPLPPVLTGAGVVLDPAAHRVTRDSREIALTPKEFAVLEVLLRAGGTVVSSEQLLTRAWDEHADPFTNAVRVAMSKLRAKLGEPAVVETVPGVGYRVRSCD
jgi:DNA-binding response OmpR family regulator